MAPDDDVTANRQSGGEPDDTGASGRDDGSSGLSRLFGAKKAAAKKAAANKDSTAAPAFSSFRSPQAIPDTLAARIPPAPVMQEGDAPPISHETTGAVEASDQAGIDSEEEVLPELGGVSLGRTDGPDDQFADGKPETLGEETDEVLPRGDLLAVSAGQPDQTAGTGGRDLLARTTVKEKPLDEKPAGPRAMEMPLTPEERERRDGDERRNEERPGADRRGVADTWAVRPSRHTNDDPLLGCLTIICTLLDRPISSDALTAGLPLDDGHLTPDLFRRAAERAGISSRLVTRKLEDISQMSLPCVVLLHGKRAAVVTHMKGLEKVTVVLPEMGAGAREIPFSELQQEYAGYTIFARPEFQFDTRAVDLHVKNPKGWFWGTIMSSWTLYVEVMIAALLINLFAIASPLFTMNVYDRVVPNFAEETLWVLAIGVTTVFVFDFILKLLRAYLVDAAGKSADTKIAARLFQQMLGMKMAHRPPSSGALANQMREFESIREFFTSSTLVALIDLPFIFMFVAIIYVIGGPVAIVPAVVVAIVIPIGMLMQIPMKKIVQETFREAQQKHAILIEAISGIETIKSTASEGRMQRSWELFVNRTARSAMRAARWSQIAMNFSSFAMQMVTVLVIIVGVYLIQEGEMTVGALVACTILSGRALAPLGQIAAIATRFHQARNSLSALDGMMQTPVERPEGRTFVNRQKFSGQIEFKDVGFTYPDAKTSALQKVSFKIEAGEKVGIIGRIGSGKSTLERLIMGLYDPTDGAVLVDGTDTRQVDPADLRRSIGVVPQDTYLFFGTVKENIALGAPYADDEMILRAARISGVDEFTSRHPLGLDMPVGERGQSLSGGQRQAISIARALLLEPPILLLDEPTSSMDNTTEGRFKQRMQSMMPGKTLILVTHRGSLLTLVDRLLVMDGGLLVADGPKDQVMEALASGRIQTAKA